jgi:hypothetical protein
MKQSRFPAGWDEKRVRKVLEHYESQSEDEAVAEDEAAYEDASQTIMEVPKELVPVIRELIAKHEKPGRTKRSTRRRATGHSGRQ